MMRGRTLNERPWKVIRYENRSPLNQPDKRVHSGRLDYSKGIRSLYRVYSKKNRVSLGDDGADQRDEAEQASLSTKSNSTVGVARSSWVEVVGGSGTRSGSRRCRVSGARSTR